MNRRRWRGVTTAVASLAATLGLLLAGMPTAAADHHSPTAREVAAGKAAVRQRERQVARAAAQLAAAQQRMNRLSTAAEVAVEAFDEARVKQQAAAQAVQAAQLVLRAASARVETARENVQRFVASAYMSGGMTTVDAMLTADGPQTLLSRVGTLEVISKAQRDATQELDAARVYQVSVEQQAQAVLDRAQKASTVAAQARTRAQQAVSNQTAVLRSVRDRRHKLNQLLAQAKQHASRLERERLAALAAARAAAVARAAAAAAAAAARAAEQNTGPVDSSGAVGDVPGTISAATGQAAVSYAESQIGKPYVWGAAGPDSYDCSGLVMWAYAHVGVNLDHWTGYQWVEGARMSTSSLRPGDLVFFATNTSDPNTIHHVGMYIGNGEMVEAPHTGAYVRISSMWRPDLIGAVRPYQR